MRGPDAVSSGRDGRFAGGRAGRGEGAAMKLLLRFFGWIFAVGTVLFLVGIAGAAGMFWHFSKDLPDYSQLQDYEPPVMTRVHATRRLAGGRIRARAAALSADPGDPEAGAQRLHRGRGQEFLRARRARLPGHRARRRCSMCRTTARAAVRRAPRPSRSRSRRTSCSPTRSRSSARSRKRCSRCGSSAPIRRTRSSSSISTKSISGSAPTASRRPRCSTSTSRCTS